MIAVLRHVGKVAAGLSLRSLVVGWACQLGAAIRICCAGRSAAALGHPHGEPADDPRARLLGRHLRERGTGQPATGENNRLRREPRLQHGDPDQCRRRHRRHGHRRRARPVCHRHHPEPQERLRRQLRVRDRHGDQHRNQHRRQGHQGRDEPRCHRHHAGRQDRLRRQLGRGKRAALGHGHADPGRHQHCRKADQRPQRGSPHRDHPGRQNRLCLRGHRAQRAGSHQHRHQHRGQGDQRRFTVGGRHHANWQDRLRSRGLRSASVTPISIATNTPSPAIRVGNMPDAIAIT